MIDRLAMFRRGWAARLTLSLTLCFALWLAVAPAARAQKLEIVLRDGLWGVAIGALLGTAQVLLLKDPQDELHRIPAAAAIGAILGVAFGIAEVSGAFAFYDTAEHRLVLGPPIPRFDLAAESRRARFDLFEARF
jgi:hypothetical protein